MNEKAKTPDERFLIELNKMVGDDLSTPVKWMKVAEAIYQTERSVRNIVKLLAQTNFVKKVGDDQVQLTPHGRKFLG